MRWTNTGAASGLVPRCWLWYKGFEMGCQDREWNPWAPKGQLFGLRPLHKAMVPIQLNKRNRYQQNPLGSTQILQGSLSVFTLTEMENFKLWKRHFQNSGVGISKTLLLPKSKETLLKIVKINFFDKASYASNNLKRISSTKYLNLKNRKLCGMLA